jgi:hypothetical protein
MEPTLKHDFLANSVKAPNNQAEESKNSDKMEFRDFLNNPLTPASFSFLAESFA